MAPTESRNRKIQYGRQAAILKMTLLKINRLLPIYINGMPLKFEVNIQSQSKHQHAYEIWNGNSKANLTYAPETMSSTDRQTDGRTMWIQYTPPPTSLGGGIATVTLASHPLLCNHFFVICSHLYEDWPGISVVICGCQGGVYLSNCGKLLNIEKLNY